MKTGIHRVYTEILILIGSDELTSYEKQAAHFIKCIREDKEPITKPKEILNVVKIIEAIYLSAETGEEIKL